MGIYHILSTNICFELTPVGLALACAHGAEVGSLPGALGEASLSQLPSVMAHLWDNIPDTQVEI